METFVRRDVSLMEALNSIRYEVIPVSSVMTEVQHLDPDARVTITCSPRLGMERTIDLAIALAASGYRVTPHLAARQVQDRAHLESILDRLVEAGVDDILVIGGDVTAPVGAFSSAVELLETIALAGLWTSDIGISGYPEGHPLIRDAELIEALKRKSSYATYIVSQMCFSSEPLRDWIHMIRAQQIALPVFVGIPGRVSRTRLLTIASKVGAGESARFLMRSPSGMFRMMLSPTYDPDDLVQGVAPLLSDGFGVAGFHVFTFNALGPTQVWRREMIEQLSRSSR